MENQIGVDKTKTADSIRQIRKVLGLSKFKEVCRVVYDGLAKDFQAYVHLEEFIENKTVVKGTDKVGRNDPCPCGSNQKYKKCCGK